MDILEIDPINFAGRVAHVAAAELAGLLVHGEISPIPVWYSDSVLGADHDVTADIDAMAGYVVERQCVGETLYRFRRAFGGREWGDAAPSTRAAFELFAATVASVAQRLTVAQLDAERRLELDTRPAPAPIALEDTIFEPVEDLHAMRPEAVASADQYAEYDRLQKEERKAAKLAKRKAQEAMDALAAQQALQGKLAATPAPLSIGETPAARPVNRGGRGNKKARPTG